MVKRIMGKRILSMAIMTVMTVSLFAGVPSKEMSTVQAAAKLKNPSTSGGVVTWDCVYFGRYPQSDKTGAKEDAIKWRVLSVNGDDAFLVADSNLDAQQYHYKFEKTTWETCTLRSWLNGYSYKNNSANRSYTKNNFIDKAFTATEQNALKTTELVPDGKNGGNSTKDKVFLLSYTDVVNTSYGFQVDTSTREEEFWREGKKYVKTIIYDKAAVRLNTAYVANGGSVSDQYKVYTNAAGEANWWMLRTSGPLSTRNVYYVGAKGEILDNGEVDTGRYAICPALHLDLSKTGVWSYAGTVSSNGASTSGEEPPTMDDAQTEVEEPGTGDIYVKDTTNGDKGTVAYGGSGNKNATSITIPKTVILQGVEYKVTGIAANAFKNNTKLKKVVMKGNITSIGNNAFYGCKNLETVTIGKNVTSIGSKAFYNCTKLTKVKIPSKVKTIGSSAFQGCTKLSEVTLGKNVTSIGSKAFYNCKVLKKITIPAKVNSIGKQAFGNCKSMKTITIETKKLTNSNVGSKAFKGVYSKATYKVPRSKKSAYKTMLKKKGVSSKAKIK